MSIISHLQEFRKRVVLAAAGIFLGSIGGWFAYGTLIKTLSKPVCGVENKIADCNTLYISGVLGPLNLQIKIALLVGVILSAPFWLYQLWAFVAPGLHKRKEMVYFIYRRCDTIFCYRSHSWLLYFASCYQGITGVYSCLFRQLNQIRRLP